MWSDPIADFCTIIRNGYMARKSQVTMPYSKFKESMAKILVKEGYLEDLKIKLQDFKKKLVVTLKYGKEGKPALRQIQRISKPGRRVYKNVKNLPKVLGGLGLAIISTSKGLLTDKEARKRNLGGEVICKLW